MLVAFSVTPLGVGEGVAEYVADAVRVVRDSGLPNRTDAMFTTVEGDWDEVMAVVKQAVDAVAAGQRRAQGRHPPRRHRCAHDEDGQPRTPPGRLGGTTEAVTGRALCPAIDRAYIETLT